MSADSGTRFPRATAALAGTLLLVALGGAGADDATPPAEAVEKARALEQQGFLEEAALYLRDLVLEAGPLAEDPDVLLELARLTPDVAEALEYVDLAISRSRDAGVLARAHRFRGDFLFAQARYAEAAEEYERGAAYGAGPVADALELRRAASLLASEDVSRAIDAYRALVEKGNATGESAPWAGLGLARAFLVRGDVREAAAEFERVARVFHDHDVRPHALAGAVECYAASLSDSAARAALAILEEEYPSSYEAILTRDLFDRVVAPRDTARTGVGDATPAPEGAEDTARSE